MTLSYPNNIAINSDIFKKYVVDLLLINLILARADARVLSTLNRIIDIGVYRGLILRTGISSGQVIADRYEYIVNSLISTSELIYFIARDTLENNPESISFNTVTLTLNMLNNFQDFTSVDPYLLELLDNPSYLLNMFDIELQNFISYITHLTRFL